MPTHYLDFNKAQFDGFKKAVARAVKNEQPEFEYLGNEYIVTFAKYVVEYLEPKFKGIK
jgi:hypothetical protein